jgi:hypothetical protein
MIQCLQGKKKYDKSIHYTPPQRMPFFIPSQQAPSAELINWPLTPQSPLSQEEEEEEDEEQKEEDKKEKSDFYNGDWFSSLTCCREPTHMFKIGCIARGLN